MLSDKQIYSPSVVLTSQTHLNKEFQIVKENNNNNKTLFFTIKSTLFLTFVNNSLIVYTVKMNTLYLINKFVARDYKQYY